MDTPLRIPSPSAFLTTTPRPTPKLPQPRISVAGTQGNLTEDGASTRGKQSKSRSGMDVL